MPDDSSSALTGARFPATRRSAVLSVGSDDPAVRARSFELLVRAYWKPVYSHVRLRWNRPAETARDLTQGFFARAFEKRYFCTYDPSKALFRTYLKACLDRFVMEEARGERRLKRGGGLARLSLEFDIAEHELATVGHPAAQSLDTYFDAAWMRSLLSTAVDALGQACAEQGKQRYFAVFRKYILDDDAQASWSQASGASTPSRKSSYGAVAQQLGLTVTDVTNYLAWTRREFRRIVLEQLRDITATDEEFRSEARAVLGIEP
jgi:DNA-directed RNA polymerase specialized sigma24 family protein